jgi:streptogramin lyase
MVGGGLSKLAPNGRPISPMTFGYSGGGLDFPGFGLAIAADGKVWITSIGAQTVSVFDGNSGQPLSPSTGYNFNGQLGGMQGVITTPNGDVWALDNDKSQVAYFPGGDASRAQLVCRTLDNRPVDGTCRVLAPFHLAIDQQDRIWITNSGADTVTRFPAADPSRAELLQVGFSPRGIAIDSQGNAWVNNMFDTKPDVPAGVDAVSVFAYLYKQATEHPGGNVALLRPDGSAAPGSPFDGAKSFNAPWGIAIDGNDNVWVANALGGSITQLCGVRTETCPPGYKTGDAISPPQTGYQGQGQQIHTDIAVDPAGNVWVANNWDLVDVCFPQGVPNQAVSTRCGGNGFVVFFGLAKPVRTPLVGPPRVP